MNFTVRARATGDACTITIPKTIVDVFDIKQDDIVMLDFVKIVKK